MIFFRAILALVAITFALVGIADPAFAGPGLPGLGAPGPIAGAGLSILAIAGGTYWLVKRMRSKTD